MQTHWHILGAGSIGCLWAYYLARAGHAVSLIVRDAALAGEQQLTLIRDGEHHQCTLQATHAGALTAIDNLLVCVKAPQTVAALDAVAHAIGDNTTLVLMQNGIGNQQLVASRFADNPVYAGITTEAALRMQPLTVEHTGSGLTQLGALGQRQDAQLVNKLYCDLHCQLRPDIQAALWQKLVINCCINPLTALYDCKNGELAGHVEAKAQLADIIHECRLVAEAAGFAEVLANIDKQVSDVIALTADNSSSMRQDLHHQRNTEIDYLNGHIVRLGAMYHIDTPVNRQLHEAIRSRHENTAE